jgi:hypothetical protein
MGARVVTCVPEMFEHRIKLSVQAIFHDHRINPLNQVSHRLTASVGRLIVSVLGHVESRFVSCVVRMLMCRNVDQEDAAVCRSHSYLSSSRFV